MEPSVYQALKNKITVQLSGLFAKVACPIEAPGKVDYGDIDFLVEGSKNSDLLGSILAAISAERHVSRGVHTFAVPLPSKGDPIYAQVDINVCEPGTLEWLAFLQSYGDLWQILGVTIRGYGLTATDKGLHVRIQESEAKNRKASMIFLSMQPKDVMDFLGLDSLRYERGFESEKQLFDWILGCKLFDKKAFQDRSEKSNDRRRLKTRGMFRRFIDEYVPHVPDRKKDAFLDRRCKVLHEALEFFDKQKEYNHRFAVIQKEMDEEIAWRYITGVIQSEAQLSNDKLNLVVRAFKRWVDFKEDRPLLRERPELDPKLQPQFAAMLIQEKDAVRVDARDWIVENWSEAKSRERERVKAEKEARQQNKGRN
ncbi:hypothetical protein H2203_001815 [Taxawa tesnikishii (nom. ined.)]|nr:hypothetical protein H2203_001815 [Dothideales sp. JES 119]